ncbi:stage VI sporulation protein D [Rossellomorea aquimaris]|uniref:stage VI sporulation protein D n=1 Tax=Rossellomorea aquimaris TaxID=189382 RepID=UPI001CD5D3E4|nr:stage VI sporulation protein D [Rossellomorea aquimaris]MCA1056334.1 stage VI sporulation protein D [Rossellomorea aquimaris]
MSQDQQSCLRFSLEESIWFKKGQEVEELLSISLDPHITIQEQEQYVLIRGTLDLSGEYLPSTPRGEEEEEDGFEAIGKFVQTVEKREKGENEFVHRFPVDVTIPKNRIANLGDIDVYVESFDYVVPENACLKLNADLTITGIYGEQQTHTPYEYQQEELHAPLYRSSAVVEEETEEEQPYYYGENEVEEEEERPSYFQGDEEEEYEAEANEVQVDESAEASEEDEYEPFSLEGRTPPAEEEDEIPVHIQYDSHTPQEEPYYRKENVFELPEHELSESSQEQEVSEAQKEPVKMQEQKPVQEVEEEEESSAVEAEMEEESSSSAEESSEQKKKFKGKKKYESISLTDFFARKEEEHAAKLRVCIVQDGETLDHIAEKYDLTVAQLLRVNNLEANQDVYNGQVLYIPNEEPVFKA